MAVSLTFDAEGCYEALSERLTQVMQILITEFREEAIRGFGTDGVAATEIINAILDKSSGKITAQCKFYADAIMQSFGTGVYADTSSQYWNEYKNSELWNNLRTGLPIVGRVKGEYTNIYGKQVESSGRNAGKIVEVISGKYGGDYFLSTPGTHSIQTAENWIMRNDVETKIERRIKLEVQKFLSEDIGKFFKEVSV